MSVHLFLFLVVSIFSGMFSHGSTEKVSVWTENAMDTMN